MRRRILLSYLINGTPLSLSLFFFFFSIFFFLFFFVVVILLLLLLCVHAAGKALFLCNRCTMALRFPPLDARVFGKKSGRTASSEDHEVFEYVLHTYWAQWYYCAQVVVVKKKSKLLFMLSKAVFCAGQRYVQL